MKALRPFLVTILFSINSFAISVIQGVTTENSAQFQVLAKEKAMLKFHLADKSTKLIEAREILDPLNSGNISHKFFVEGLSPNTRYQLDIVATDGSHLARKTFKTLDSNKKSLRIVLASCMKDHKTDLAKLMWGQVNKQDPDFIFLLGDNVYVDHGGGEITEERIWRRYAETRERIPVYSWDELVPLLATWDDHDYGLNNSNRTFPHNAFAGNTFRAFYAQDGITKEVSKGPGISTNYHWNGFQFVFLDNRTFRAPIGHPDETHWGKEQYTWLFQQFQGNDDPVFLLNGSQFFGGFRDGGESFENNHPNAFKRLINDLARQDNPVVFNSGDVHYSELMKIEEAQLGYETYEITSSSIHSRAHIFPRPGNPRRMEGTGFYNFIVVDLEKTPRGLSMDLKSIGKKGKVYFERQGLKVER